MPEEKNNKETEGKKPHPPHHDIPPHILKELMYMREKIGKLQGQMEILIKMRDVK